MDLNLFIDLPKLQKFRANYKNLIISALKKTSSSQANILSWDDQLELNKQLNLDVDTFKMTDLMSVDDIGYYII